jgi:hypothetical protein
MAFFYFMEDVMDRIHITFFLVGVVFLKVMKNAKQKITPQYAHVQSCYSSQPKPCRT